MELDDAKPALQIMASKPDFALTVVHPFGNYKRGDLIADAADIAAVVAGENIHHCHKVAPQ